MKNYLFLAFLYTLAFTNCEKYKVRQPPESKGATVPGVTNSYFVSDALGSDANPGTTTSYPLKTIAAAYNKVSPGDTVFILNGTYTGGTVLNITKSGTADKYITFKNYPGQSPKMYITGNVYNGVVINGSYIVFDGIEMQGDNANITYANALASYNLSLAGSANPNAGTYNTNAISIGGPGTESKMPHHVVIRNCKVHDFPGGGISSIQADYTTIEGNTVYNNAWYMMYAGSGISILNPVNSDAGDITKYKNYIRNNICFGNKTTIPWIGITPARLSDGNGIIIDVNQTGYNGTGAAFNGRTLVENNVSVNNGGSGIHSFKADHVDIINNTAYGNGTVVGYADIYAGSANDVKIINNIMYARTGGRCNTSPTGFTVTYNNNVYFNGTVAFMGTNDKVANPGFVNLSTDITVANFSLNAGSPAIDYGSSVIFSAKDIRGIPRPQGAAVDCGAYEYKP